MSRGGSRTGSGRKKLPESEKKQRYSTLLRHDQIDWLRSQKKAASLLEKLIDKHIEENEEMKQSEIERLIGTTHKSLTDAAKSVQLTTTRVLSSLLASNKDKIKCQIDKSGVHFVKPESK